MPPVHYKRGTFPPDAHLDWRRLVPLIGPTAAAIARYDSLLGAVPHPRSLLAVLRVREAVQSSRIDNIYTSIAAVLALGAGVRLENKQAPDDARAVLNYLEAESGAIRRIQRGPLSSGMVREAHAMLLAGPRGRGKSPGEFRNGPIWIGGPDATLDTATFVPAAPAAVPDAMGAWERYTGADVRDRLVQIAAQHAEFEAVHPFVAGNGRTGRMLIPLLMWQRELIRLPFYCLSVQIAARRGFYFDRLLGVSRDGDWTGWCMYFLDEMRIQAEHGAQTVGAILKLYESLKQHPGITRARYRTPVLTALFARPVFLASDFIATTGIPARSARRLLARLEDVGVVEETLPARGRRAAVMQFTRMLKIVEGRDGSGRWPHRNGMPASVTPPVGPPFAKSPHRSAPR